MNAEPPSIAATAPRFRQPVCAANAIWHLSRRMKLSPSWRNRGAVLCAAFASLSVTSFERGSFGASCAATIRTTGDKHEPARSKFLPRYSDLRLLRGGGSIRMASVDVRGIVMSRTCNGMIDAGAVPPDEDGRDECTGHVAGCAWVERYENCTCPPDHRAPPSKDYCDCGNWSGSHCRPAHCARPIAF